MLIDMIYSLIVLTIIIVVIYTIIKTRKEIRDLHFKMDVALRLIDRIPKDERENIKRIDSMED